MSKSCLLRNGTSILMQENMLTEESFEKVKASSVFADQNVSSVDSLLRFKAWRDRLLQ